MNQSVRNLRAIVVACALVLVGAVLVPPALAQAPAAGSTEYRIGLEDGLTVSVWLHPELERSVRVKADGTITFPPLGNVRAAGMTPAALGDHIAERLSTYLRQTATVTVTVTDFVSRSVFVSGAVAKPGRFGFERIPGLMDVIDAAGGVTAVSDLSRVQVLRREGDARRVINVDVAQQLQLGAAGVFPDLEPGDTVVVPALSSGNLAPGTGVGVLGAVQRPGVYGVGDGQELLSVLAAAGGITQDGDLAKVRVVRTRNQTQSVVTLNLKQTLRAGGSPYVLQSGDVVFVDRTGQSGWGKVGSGLATLLTASRDVLNVAVLVVLLNDNNRNP